MPALALLAWRRAAVSASIRRMPHRYCVVGAGRQGGAVAYDLALHGGASAIRLADADGDVAAKVAQRVNFLTRKNLVSPAACDASRENDLEQTVRGATAVVSALPYFLNFLAARVAIESEAHFCDLGGNTAVVLQELELDAFAKRKNVSLLPDCGLAPGLSNLLAARSLEKLDSVHTIRARCGGLPQKPRPPLGYKLVFSPDGLINEYSGTAVCLCGGEIEKVPALTGFEEVECPPLGRLEAAVTTGGTSTAPYSFRGRVQHFDYKTLRYPGHFAAMKAYADLGLFGNERVTVGGQTFVPRRLLVELLRPLIDFPDDRDLVILLVDAEGEKGGRPAKYAARLFDQGDKESRFSAMERTTGYPAALTAFLQASGNIPAGAAPIEKAVPSDLFFEQLGRRGLAIEETVG